MISSLELLTAFRSSHICSLEINPLDEDVVEENVDDDVVAGVDFAVHLPAAIYDVFSVRRKSGLTAPTL